VWRDLISQVGLTKCDELAGQFLSKPRQHIADKGAASITRAKVASKRDSALFAFQSVPVHSPCVQHAELTLFAPHGSSAGPVRLYPSAALSFALGKAIADSNGGPGPFSTINPQPTPPTPRRLTKHSTSPRSCACGRTEARSHRRTVGSATNSPLVLNLRIPDSTSGGYEVVFSAAKPAPRLVLTTRPGCK
jgi:hypothetical protein